MKTHTICSTCQKNYHVSFPACPYCEEARRERGEQEPVQRDDLRARLEAVTAERDALLAALEPVLDERNIDGGDEYVIIGLTPAEWRQIREAVRKAGGGE